MDQASPPERHLVQVPQERLREVRQSRGAGPVERVQAQLVERLVVVEATGDRLIQPGAVVPSAEDVPQALRHRRVDASRQQLLLPVGPAVRRTLHREHEPPGIDGQDRGHASGVTAHRKRIASTSVRDRSSLAGQSATTRRRGRLRLTTSDPAPPVTSTTCDDTPPPSSTMTAASGSGTRSCSDRNIRICSMPSTAASAPGALVPAASLNPGSIHRRRHRATVPAAPGHGSSRAYARGPDLPPASHHSTKASSICRLEVVMATPSRRSSLDESSR